KGLIGARELALVKPTVRIINCARGGLIDDRALLQAINEGRVAGAAIDVFAKEPPSADDPLLKCDKIIVTTHLGASTEEAQINVSLDAATQVVAVLTGQPARYSVNCPLMSPETLSAVGPFFNVASIVASAAAQLAQGQAAGIDIAYDGEIANYDVSVLKANIIGALLEGISEERINVVNSSLVAQKRGMSITEHKNPASQNYANLITVTLSSSAGVTSVAGTLMRDEIHIVRVGSYWLDLVIHKDSYFLFADHLDRPGLIGAVGMITGKADIDINFMLVSRLKARGQALMVLGLDEPLNEAQIKQILAIPDIYTARVVTLQTVPR
ncbi:MAG: phosphoglycerate dehydrogenase, partial [Chloroflexi bacterium]|nr:phosphoglycerate dehydrogenase [Chloroflexota bacterium]